MLTPNWRICAPWRQPPAAPGLVNSRRGLGGCRVIGVTHVPWQLPRNRGLAAAGPLVTAFCMPGGGDDRGGPSSRALMHARARRDVAARLVLRGDCGGQQPQTCRKPRIGHQAPAGPCGWPSGDPAMPSAVTACAWRLLTGAGVHARSAAGPRYRSRRARAGSPPPARRRPPCHPDRAAASRSPRSPPASQPAGRTLMPESPLTSNPAASPHGRPGRAPDLRTPGRPRPPCTPGHRTARVTTAISAPPVRGRTGCTPGPRRPSSHRRAAAAARPWPSVESRRCTPTVLAAGRRPLLYVRGRRDTGTYSVTR